MRENEPKKRRQTRASSKRPRLTQENGGSTEKVRKGVHIFGELKSQRPLGTKCNVMRSPEVMDMPNARGLEEY
jgi:hypothetical protein